MGHKEELNRWPNHNAVAMTIQDTVLSENPRQDSQSEEIDTELEELLSEVVEELNDRFQQGEQPKLEDYLNNYPELSDPLRQAFEVLSLLYNGRVPAMLDTQPSVTRLPNDQLCATQSLTLPSSEVPLGRLGDFRLLRQVGKGGMGIVYEAEEISLGRRVALKTLPLAAMLDSTQLQRFQNEARAAAMLEHPHIVGVFSVGSERGVYYYAMRYIDGHPLNDVIQQMRRNRGKDDQNADGKGERSAPNARYSDRAAFSSHGTATSTPTASNVESLQPASFSRGEDTLRMDALSTEDLNSSPAYFQRVARMGIQVAEALEYAHGLGIVHRDIKPGNLLIDQAGKVWVTDFGLAHVEANPSLTMTGDVLGTARYMSPEQASGTKVLLDHRTDIYSLGVTLYELLCLQTAFPGTDRRTILRQVLEEEPRAPRRVRPEIPEDLETILLKAMAKHPSERYQSAAELAADLGRFLKYEPIKARRPSLAARTSKWFRRHPSLLRALAALLVTLTATLAASTWLIWKEKERAKAALYRAEKEERRANDQAGHAQIQQALAEQNLQHALTAVDQMLTRVGDQGLDNIPQLETVRLALMNKAVDFYERLLVRSDQDPEVRYALALALGRLAWHHKQLGNDAASETAVRRRIEILEELHQRFPDDERHAFELADAYRQLPDYGFMINGPESGLEYINRAIAVLEPVLAKLPKDYRCRDGLAGTWLANLFRARGGIHILRADSAKAEADLETAIRLCGDAPDWGQEVVAECNHLLARLRTRQGRFEEARLLVQQSLAIDKQRHDRQPDYIFARRCLFERYSLLAKLLNLLHRGEEAEDAYRQAIHYFDELISDYPNFRMFHSLGNPRYSFATYLVQQSREDELDQLLAGVDIASVEHDHFELALALSRAGRKDDAIKLLDEILRAAADDDRRRADAYRKLALVHLGHGELASALPRIDEAIAIRERIEAESPDDLYNRYLLQVCHMERGDILENANRLAESEAAYRRSLEYEAQSRALHPEATFLLERTARYHLMPLLSKLGRHDEAQQMAADGAPYTAHQFCQLAAWHMSQGDFEKAIDQFVAAAERGPVLPYFYKRWGLSHFHLGQFDQALAMVAKGVEGNPYDTTSLTWIPTGDVASCPDKEFQKGMLALADRTIELTNGIPQAHLARARLLLAMGQTDSAYRDLEIAFRSDQAVVYDSAYEAYLFALLQLHRGDINGYRQTCQAMLARFADTNDPVTGRWVGWMCVLAPNAVEDYEPVLEWVERSLKGAPDTRSNIQTMAGLLLRAGRKEEALTRLLDAHELPDEDAGGLSTSPAYCRYLLAIACHDLGKFEESQRWLAQANEGSDEAFANDSTPWNRRQTLELFRRETSQF